MSEKVSLSKLNAVSYNPRIISTEQLERLKSSIKKHTTAIPNSEGYRLTTTVTINKNGNRIVGGHQRIKALKSLGQDWIHINDITWIDLIPDSAEEKALNVTLNSERFQGNWDQSKLDEILSDICVDNKELFIDLDLAPIDNISMPSFDVPVSDFSSNNSSNNSSTSQNNNQSISTSDNQIKKGAAETIKEQFTADVKESKTVIGSREVDDEDIDRVSERLESEQQNRVQEKIFSKRSVMCPECGKEFLIDEK